MKNKNYRVRHTHRTKRITGEETTYFCEWDICAKDYASAVDWSEQQKQREIALGISPTIKVEIFDPDTTAHMRLAELRKAERLHKEATA